MINIPACPNCGVRGYNLLPSELAMADGFSNCEMCNFPQQPDAASLNMAAIELAVENTRDCGQLVYNPADFLSQVQRTRDELLEAWKAAYDSQLAEWFAKKYTGE